MKMTEQNNLDLLRKKIEQDYALIYELREQQADLLERIEKLEEKTE